MADQQQNEQERRGYTSELIDHMLIERNQLLSLLLKISDLGHGDLTESDQETFEEFCQVLVDYIAAGHFGLYDRIIKKTERRKNVADLALRIYPGIDKTTQTALRFNEKYDPEKRDRNPAELHLDLSMLGEELATRIELEDQLIDCLKGTEYAKPN